MNLHNTTRSPLLRAHGRIISVVLSAFLLFVGCSENSGNDPNDSNNSEITVDPDWPDDMEGLYLAAGTTIPEPLEEGDILTWEAGGQGGFHVWAGFRAIGEGFAALDEEQRDLIEHHYIIEDHHGEFEGHPDVPIASAWRRGFVDVVDGGIQVAGIMVSMEPWLFHPADFENGPYKLELTVELPSGEVYEDSRWIDFDF